MLERIRVLEFMEGLFSQAQSIPDTPLFHESGCEVFIRRFDLIHPEISGNKLFKLHGCLQNWDGTKPLLSFGGAYSNHLLALSALGKACQIQTIGIIRGEEPAVKSHRLQQMQNNEMRLIFVSRSDYQLKTEKNWLEKLKNQLGDFFLIPEGGAGLLGIEGASNMVCEQENYDLVVIPAGTGTTAAGISLKLKDSNTDVLTFQVLKGENIIKKSIEQYMDLPPNLLINEDFHFGGYAKQNQELIEFSSLFEEKYQLELDLVYGYKAMYGLLSLIKQEKIKHKRILYIHSGGL